MKLSDLVELYVDNSQVIFSIENQFGTPLISRFKGRDIELNLLNYNVISQELESNPLEYDKVMKVTVEEPPLSTRVVGKFIAENMEYALEFNLDEFLQIFQNKARRVNLVRATESSKLFTKRLRDKLYARLNNGQLPAHKIKRSNDEIEVCDKDSGNPLVNIRIKTNYRLNINWYNHTYVKEEIIHIINSNYSEVLAELGGYDGN